jgi:hypothetical protein
MNKEGEVCEEVAFGNRVMEKIKRAE